MKIITLGQGRYLVKVLSYETKPLQLTPSLALPLGTFLTELDTRKLYQWDGVRWNKK